MALDKSFIGKTFPPFTYEVDKSKIRELVLALGEDDPIFWDDEAARAGGLSGLVAPPTFPTLFKMWGEGGNRALVQAMGGDPLRVLHGEEEYEYHGFIRPGDLITGQSTVISLEEKEGRSGRFEIVVVKTEYRNQRAELAVVARSTIVVRE